MKLTIVFLLLAFTAIIPLKANSIGDPPSQKKKNKSPKNIILMIGDGMGTAQVYMGLTAKKGQLNLAKFPISGFVITNSSDNYITDSGAGATAYATGSKTNNGYISVAPDGTILETILEAAEKKGLSTGLVATSSITHATPAGFIAHTSNRGNMEDIAMDFLKTDIDIFIGGGYNNFALRKDSLNLIDSLISKGYFVARDINDIDLPTVSKVAGLLAPGHLPKLSAGRKDMLSKASEMAMKLLSRNKKGFFLMIEGSQIDWGGHDNSLEYVRDEMVDFDDAVGKVLEFARKNGETLVIVTADHETGGLALTGGDIPTGKVEGGFIHKDHTAVMVPVFAFGPGAENFSGIMENTDVNRKCMDLLKLKYKK
ncbi:MAG: alkaline phosphatase [Bacteroidales bacterium]|nr:alkaline phosphatase [Bacteroidales bacterium]